MWNFIVGTFLGVVFGFLLHALLAIEGCLICQEQWRKTLDYYKNKGAFHGD